MQLKTGEPVVRAGTMGQPSDSGLQIAMTIAMTIAMKIVTARAEHLVLVKWVEVLVYASGVR